MNVDVQERLLELDKVVTSILSPGDSSPFKPLLWIEFNLHDIMRVAFKHLGAIETMIPVPQFDRHVVTA